MKKTTLEYDEQLFEQVRQELGTKGLKQTVNEAFKELIRARATEAFIHHLRTGDLWEPPEVIEELERKRRLKKNPWLEPLDT